MAEAINLRSFTSPLAPPLRLLSDDRLARRVSRGDDTAFGLIYERHHQALYRYCRSLVTSPDDARDALQATMESALKALRRRDRDVAVRPWLYRIAHNESISLLRRRRAHVSLEDVEPGGGGDVDLAVEARERFVRLVGDLHELPERQRGALVMRELSDLSFGQIAAAFGISEAAAKQSVHEARVALRDREEGRAMTCDAITRLVSERDGRRMQGRRVRAHLASCASCRDFAAAIGRRRSDLAALAGPLPAPAALALVKGLLGGGGAGGTGGGAVAAGAASVPFAATALGTAAAAVVLAVGTVGVVTGDERREPSARPDAGVALDGAAARTAAPRERTGTARRVAAGPASVVADRDREDDVDAGADRNPGAFSPTGVSGAGRPGAPGSPGDAGGDGRDRAAAAPPPAPAGARHGPAEYVPPAPAALPEAGSRRSGDGAAAAPSAPSMPSTPAPSAPSYAPVPEPPTAPATTRAP